MMPQNMQNMGPGFEAFVMVIFAFQIWMTVDSVRRRSPFLWSLLVFLIPLAAIIYFATIFVPAFRNRKALPAGPTIEELAEQVRLVPSEANRLTLADRLALMGRLPEAVGRYREILRQNKESKEALHGLSRAFLALGRPQEAVEELANLMEIEPAFRDYSAALDYAEALWQAGKHDDTIGLLSGLVGVSKRIEHRTALAHYLKEQGDKVTARSELDQALRDFDSSPESVQRRDSALAERARKLLAELS